MFNTGMKWMMFALMAAGLSMTPDSSWARGGRGWGGRGGGWGGGRSGVYLGIGGADLYGGYGRGGYYGSPGYYGGYGNGYYGGGYYGGGYYPSYGYSNGYSYPSYTSGDVIYNTPNYNPSPALSNNVPMSNPATGASVGGEVIIENSPENGSPLNYSLNGNSYTIQPGQAQRIVNDRQWIVEFDRGDGRGSARYSLSQGRFKFKPTGQGWELVRSLDQAETTHSTAKPPLPNPNLNPELNSLDAAPEPR